MHSEDAKEQMLLVAKGYDLLAERAEKLANELGRRRARAGQAVFEAV